MRKAINTEHLEGRIYQHDLVVKQVQNKDSENFGKDFISGNLEVAVDEDGLNVIQVHYTYVPEFTKSGGRSSTFLSLKKIIDEGKAWITDGKEAATKVQIDTALALNDFYAQDDTLISVKRNEGGFVTIVNSICKEGIDRHKFTTDMLINSTKMVEPEDIEKQPYLIIKGAVFNFRNDILPVEFVVRNPEGINYFENLNISSKNPVYTKLWGKINSITTKEKKEEQSAFGEAAISFVERKTKEWTVTGVSPNPYDFGDENILTQEDVTKAMQNREVMLAERKKQSEDWKANRITNNTNSFAQGTAMNLPGVDANTVKAGGFNF